MYKAQDIRELLLNNEKAVYRGLITLYKFQTTNEKRANQSLYQNGAGFNKPDAQRMSAFAKFVLDGHKLNESNLGMVRETLLKYSGQLAQVANEKAVDKMLKELTDA